MVKLYLIRHGESEWNRLQRYSGQQDVSLSSLGELQAERIAERLAETPLDAIYASPLRRARDTANAIGLLKRMAVSIEPELAELQHGLWEGLTECEVREKFSHEHERWLNAPHTLAMPEGESLAEVARRVRGVMARITGSPEREQIAIVSHDAVLRVMLLDALGLSLEHFQKWRIENASLTVLETMEETPNSFRLASLNDTTHLQGVRSEYELQAR